MEDNNKQNNTDEQVDLLTEESYINDHFVYATQRQRFLNLVIDNLLMRYG